MKARRYSDAADEYRDLLIHAGAENRPAAELALADALHRSGRNREAKAELATLPGATAEQNAQRLYILGEVAWASDENDVLPHGRRAAASMAPTSPWLESALLSVANLHLVHHEYDQALDAFRELQQRFPKGSRASYAHWKAAWLTLRQGRNDEAKKAFEEQIALYPASNETSAALYWRARLAEEDNQPGMARAFYQKLSDRYRNYYYAELGRAAAEEASGGRRSAGTVSVARSRSAARPRGESHAGRTSGRRSASAKGRVAGQRRPGRFRRARTAGGRQRHDGGNWGPAETAQLYTDTGHYDRAIEVMKRSVPSYFAVDIPTLPREYWEALFPGRTGRT